MDDDDDYMWVFELGSDRIATVDPPSLPHSPGAAAHLPPGLYSLAPGSDRHLLRHAPITSGETPQTTDNRARMPVATGGESDSSSPPRPETPNSARSEGRRYDPGADGDRRKPDEDVRDHLPVLASADQPALASPVDLADNPPVAAVASASRGQRPHGEVGAKLASSMHHNATSVQREEATLEANIPAAVEGGKADALADWWNTEWALESVMSQLRQHWAFMNKTWWERQYRAEIIEYMSAVSSITDYQARIQELNRLLSAGTEHRLAVPPHAITPIHQYDAAIASPVNPMIGIGRFMPPPLPGACDYAPLASDNDPSRPYNALASRVEGTSSHVSRSTPVVESKNLASQVAESAGRQANETTIAEGDARILEISLHTLGVASERYIANVADDRAEDSPANTASANRPNGPSPSESTPSEEEARPAGAVPEREVDTRDDQGTVIHEAESLHTGSSEVGFQDERPDPDAGVIGEERANGFEKQRLLGTARFWSDDATALHPMAEVWAPLQHHLVTVSSCRCRSTSAHGRTDSPGLDEDQVDTVGFFGLDEPVPMPTTDDGRDRPGESQTSTVEHDDHDEHVARPAGPGDDKSAEAEMSRSMNDDLKSNYSVEYPSLATASSSKRDKGKGRAVPKEETEVVAESSRSVTLNADAQTFQPVQRAIEPPEQMQWLRAKMEEMRRQGEQQATAAHALDRHAAFPHFLVPVVGMSACGQRYYDDWICECKYHNFGRNARCNRCGVAGPRTENKRHELALGIPGDWDCRCGATNWRRRRTCHKCGLHQYFGAVFYY